MEGELGVHSWRDVIHDRTVNFQALRLRGQVVVWVGEGEPRLGSLAAGVPGTDCPSTQVLGAGEQSLQLAGRLAKKLGKQVFVSWNLEEDVLFTPLVLTRLMREIKEQPDKF